MPQVITCRVDGCEREAQRKVKQLCDAHYQQERRGVPFTEPRTPRGQGGKTPCDFPGCDKPKRSAGYCHGHYQQHKLGKELTTLRPLAKTTHGAICVADGCTREVEVNVHQVCRPHYKRLKRHGDINSGGTAKCRGGSAEELLHFHGWDEVQRVDGLSACWEWRGARCPVGYGRVDTRFNGSSLAPRLAYSAWIGDVSKIDFVCHRCDNPPCINPAHLFGGSRQDNVDDMVNKKRHIHGTRALNHILTDEDVLEIRAKHVPYKYTFKMLGEEYGVAPSTISNAYRGNTWRHVV